MTHPKPFCVICSKKSEPLISFTNDTLNKCQTVLKIRKDNDLSMSDVRLPENISSASKYHSKCYRQFTALSKKYRKPKQIDSSETSDLPRIFKSQLWSHAAQQITTITNPIDYGWKEEDGIYTFKWFDGEQLPEIQDITEDLSENISDCQEDSEGDEQSSDYDDEDDTSTDESDSQSNRSNDGLKTRRDP